MSAILRLTEETILLDKGQVVLRSATPKAVDYYMESGYAQTGLRTWDEDEIPPDAKPFSPISLRLDNGYGQPIDTARSIEPLSIVMEYRLEEPITGLRVGIYLMTTRGEYVFTSFDTDHPDKYERFSVRQAGHYTSICTIPANFLNEGRYVLGINASSFRVKRYFQDEHALTFTVDGTGAPGMQWAELRLGTVRPNLDWRIESV
jgi:lipopolysaccharide transport system ATP-binding protein